MKFTCKKSQLKDAVSAVEKSISRSSTQPLLQAILFIANGKSLTLRATNLETGVEYTIPAKIENDGTCAIPGVTISSFIANIPGEDTVSMEEKGGNMMCVTGPYKSTIKGFSAKEFPTLPSGVEGDRIYIDSRKLVSGISSVVWSASTSDIKPELSSVYFYPERDYFVFVATDSFRLAEKKIQLKNIKDFPGVIIPARTAMEISRIFSSIDGVVEARITKNQIVLSYEHLYFTARIIDGTFPDYHQIVPKGNTTEVVVLKQDLSSALKANSVFSDKFHQMTLMISSEKKRISVETKNADVGEGAAILEGTINGEDVSAQINNRFILDAMNSFGGDSILISLNGAHKPIVFRVVGDASFTYLVMPMNR